MAKLTIDNRQVEAAPGQTVLDAARKLGIEIPTLCFRDGLDAPTSCMVCVVKIAGRASLQPACATAAEDGMVIESDTAEVRHARRTALELLLSDHLGDCMGPCQTICPAHMDIPLMTRQIVSGQMREAIATVKRDIALPAVLGRICPAPCESGCRRKQADAPVAICLLKRFVADTDLATAEPYLPRCAEDSSKRVAVIGAGPAGLAAAFHLRLGGHGCEVFDANETPGGGLQYDVPADRLDRDVLASEIAIIRRIGVSFHANTRVGRDVSMDQLREQFDAVVVAIGADGGEQAEALGLPAESDGIAGDRKTYATSVAGVFAAGNCIRKRNKLAVRSLADGKEAAVSVDQFLRGLDVVGPARPFNTRIGRLAEEELSVAMAWADSRRRVEPGAAASGGFSETEARNEGARCLRCDCRKADRCLLREHSQTHLADPRAYRCDRPILEIQDRHGQVVYEPGKCITCGLCVQITERAREPIGLTFIGRGFDVRVAVPFGKDLAEGLQKAAAECVAACPTAALAWKDSPR